MTRSSEHNGAFLKAVFVLYLISYSIVKSRGLFYLIDDLGSTLTWLFWAGVVSLQRFRQVSNETHMFLKTAIKKEASYVQKRFWNLWKDLLQISSFPGSFWVDSDFLFF